MNSVGTGLFVRIFTYLTLLFIIAPLAVIVSISISDNFLAMFPPTGFTMEWYSRVLAEPDFQRAFMTSLVLALCATGASLLLGTPAAIAINRRTMPGAAAIETLLLSPMILPILITGLALMQFFASASMHSAKVNLFVGHTIITLPYMLRTLTASLRQIDPALEEAARTLGATSFTVFRKIIVPQIAPGLLAGSLFAFMISFDDFPISLWLSNARTEPLPIYLHNEMNAVFDPSIAAMSSLMILTGVIVVVALEKIVGLRKAMGV